MKLLEKFRQYRAKRRVRKELSYYVLRVARLSVKFIMSGCSDERVRLEMEHCQAQSFRITKAIDKIAGAPDVSGVTVGTRGIEINYN